MKMKNGLCGQEHDHLLIFNPAHPFLHVNKVEHFHIKLVYDIPFGIIKKSQTIHNSNVN